MTNRKTEFEEKIDPEDPIVKEFGAPESKLLHTGKRIILQPYIEENRYC